ncbi:3-deoxy-manno-octulosonate-8-phosphatase KdsC [Candidatus Vesicomyidisocius calyptogenae]|uniref:3-deoxy-D-manno-octulosonate 8-phosphate phosphatase KdsC n=1 Tax=Vesicomyosocius okutanii subsp. Calyptogena okutanii (strain HA) TaxID=412965 RepID=A5CVI4_VESOH|nr:3-deoxy-manno-octulosonate-8-phosphatase KdsC [Candidatus Vesicomyosocius okutanii]BAF62042.1 3-deoxy-D-manno-octulosonate 8-phosphate phosphatase [Candidatus Vesicomyosocius okutanii]
MQLSNKFYLKAKNIKLIIFDVDGVLTDGGLYFSDKGIELKRFNSLDGLGIKLLKQNGIESAIISARSSKNVMYRMKNLDIKHFYQGQDNKIVAFNNLIKKLSLKTEQVAYIGDDIIDLPVMRKIGLPIAVSNAHELVKKNAYFITKKIGGHGAVREVCDLLLQSQNTYNKTMDKYLT